MPARRVANLHLDVLDGRDETLDPSDFLPCAYIPMYTSNQLADTTGDMRDLHTAMERKWGV